jgi:hypothetical protein
MPLPGPPGTDSFAGVSVIDGLPMRKVSDDERRARLGSRHRLVAAARTDDVVRFTTDVVALHATDASTVHLAAAARMVTPSTAAMEEALYDDRSLVRMLGMRRTMFVVPDDLAPVVQASCTDAIAAVERRRLVQHLQAAGVAKDVPRWLRKVEADTLRALAERGEATATELAAAVPALRIQLSFGEGRDWTGTQGVSTRVLSLLAAEGHIVRGRPRGTWTSNQHRWALMAAWLPRGAHTVDAEAASTELLRRYLAAFGPVSTADMRWWTGWTAGKVTRALAAVGVREVELTAGPGFVLAEDAEPVAEAPPWAALLPSLDPTAMGWTERDWYVGPHRTALFDRSGNIGPTVWWNGKVVGGWAQRRDGEVVHRLLDDVGRDARRVIEAEVERTRTFLGAARVTPRFRTPLERELVS